MPSHPPCKHSGLTRGNKTPSWEAGGGKREGHPLADHLYGSRHCCTTVTVWLPRGHGVPRFIYSTFCLNSAIFKASDFPLSPKRANTTKKGALVLPSPLARGVCDHADSHILTEKLPRSNPSFGRHHTACQHQPDSGGTGFPLLRAVCHGQPCPAVNLLHVLQANSRSTEGAKQHTRRVSGVEVNIKKLPSNQHNNCLTHSSRCGCPGRAHPACTHGWQTPAAAWAKHPLAKGLRCQIEKQERGEFDSPQRLGLGRESQAGAPTERGNFLLCTGGQSWQQMEKRASPVLWRLFLQRLHPHGSCPDRGTGGGGCHANPGPHPRGRSPASEGAAGGPSLGDRCCTALQKGTGGKTHGKASRTTQSSPAGNTWRCCLQRNPLTARDPRDQHGSGSEKRLQVNTG